jgi:hypothetical protein
MRYLVKARVKLGREADLLRAISSGDLGRGSIAGDEYNHNMKQARWSEDGNAHWVETCFCATPLAEERPYWEDYFNILQIKNAHNPSNCRDVNGTEPWACCDCTCTARLQERIGKTGQPFLVKLREVADSNNPEKK